MLFCLPGYVKHFIPLVYYNLENQVSNIQGEFGFLFIYRWNDPGSHYLHLNQDCAATVLFVFFFSSLENVRIILGTSKREKGSEGARKKP